MRTRNKLALIFFCLLLSAAAVLSGVEIYSELKEQQKEKEDFAAVAEIAELPMTEAPAESVTDAETEPSAEPTEQPAAEHNIQALIAENSDCIGWLSIDGTNISYPVMYTPSEPQKYLRRNLYGKYSQSGVPFLDGRCCPQSTNLIIYGHNMRNGTMFSDLKKYVEGYPSHYFKQDVPVQLDGSEVTAMVYIMNLKMDFGLPSSYYYDIVQEGYEDCGLDSSVLEQALRESTRQFYCSHRPYQESFFHLNDAEPDEDEPEENDDSELDEDEQDETDPFYFSGGMHL